MHSSSTSTKDEHVNKGPLRPLKGNSRISKQTEREEDILAPPKELSDDDFSSSDDERLRAATIKPTTFKSGNGAQKSSSQNPRGRAGSKQTSNQVAASKSKRSGHHTVAQNDTSPKRKIPEDVPSSSADIFGSIKSKKAKSTYGSSSQNKKLSSSQVSAPRSTQEKQTADESFKSYSLGSSPGKIASPVAQLSIPNGEGLNSPKSSPAKSSATRKAKSKALKDAVLDSEDESEDDYQTLKLPSFEEETGSSGQNRSAPVKAKIPPKDPELQTQAQAFQRYSFDGDSKLLSHVNEIILRDRSEIHLHSTQDVVALDDGEPLTQIQHVAPTCPMCGTPVDQEDLVKAGEMTTRTQELFCRAHQRKSALRQWSERNYPEISWSSLPARIEQYKKDIQKWIIGKPPSYYRSLYSSALAKGENKNLRKTTSNLIPGYYGPRGSQIISEFVMEHFSELLRKRAPKDRIISKGGATAYVQAVVVMEVASKLIGEDMAVEEEEARGILDDSIILGDLLWQEEVIGVSILRRDDIRTIVDRTEDEEEDSEDELA